MSYSLFSSQEKNSSSLARIEFTLYEQILMACPSPLWFYPCFPLII